MFSNKRTIRIEWGQCDPAGIIFYPRYFEIFDNSTTAMFSVALGMNKFQFMRKYALSGYPMVDTRGRFLLPTRYGDDVLIETKIVRLGRSSFDVEHRIYLGDKLAVEGFETRVWAGRDPNDPDKIVSKPIPPDVVEVLSKDRA